MNNTLVSYPERGEGGNNKYQGNCSPRLIEDLIRHFGMQQISDYMCGSGTTRDAARQVGIQSSVYDLHSGYNMLCHDIPERPENIFWHPPYHDMIIYSDRMYPAADVHEKFGYDPRAYDLSRIPTWDEFVKVMNYCMMKQFCALEKGGRMAVLVGDLKRKGKLYSMVLELIKPGTLEQIVIKTQHNCNSDNRSYSGRFIRIAHEYLVILKKEAGLIFPVLLSKRVDSDIRDMRKSTWRDVVAAVLRELNGPSKLDSIYRLVEGHQKTESNTHWKEKIRQTLQLHTNVFRCVEKGVWTLIREGVS